MMPSPMFFQLEKAKQERLIKAATSEFARKGYKGASIDIIIRKSGVAKGSIFNYFGDKQGLFAYVFEYSLEKVKGHIKEVRNNTSDYKFFERLTVIANEGIKFIRKNPNIFKLYLRLHNETEIEVAAQLIGIVRAYSVRFLSDLIDDAKRKGEILNESETSVYAFVLDSILERFLQAYSQKHMGLPFGVYKVKDGGEAFIKSVFDLLKKGFMHV